MGMGEEQERSYMATPPAVKSSNQRMAEDLKWFEEQFAAEFPHIASGSADYMLARYWYLAALGRAADYESEVMLGINTELELITTRMREELG